MALCSGILRGSTIVLTEGFREVRQKLLEVIGLLQKNIQLFWPDFWEIKFGSGSPKTRLTKLAIQGLGRTHSKASSG